MFTHSVIGTDCTAATCPERPTSSYLGTGASSLCMGASGTCTAANVGRALHEQTQNSGEQRGRRPGIEIGTMLPLFAGQVGGCSSSGNAECAIMSTLRSALTHLSTVGRDRCAEIGSTKSQAYLPYPTRGHEIGGGSEGDCGKRRLGWRGQLTAGCSGRILHRL